MSIYVIGDVQGCYDSLQKLLEKIRFDSDNDRLWFVGDLVNRGPDSVSVIRLVKSLGDRAVTVLGNHDLHLLAVASGVRKIGRKDNFHDVLEASDASDLIDWLRQQKLMHFEQSLNTAMVHAGLPPQWSIQDALQRAAEVEQVLRGTHPEHFFRDMYGDEPAVWTEQLKGYDRLRFITNCFTRLRYCDGFGRLQLRYKLAPGTQPAHLKPWFEFGGRHSSGTRIVFGHWSTLGYCKTNNIIATDTGCLWGGQLSAIELKPASHRLLQLRCPQTRAPAVASGNNQS